MTRHDMLDQIRAAHIILGVAVYAAGWLLVVKRWKAPVMGVAFTVLTVGQFVAAARAGERDEGWWTLGSNVIAFLITTGGIIYYRIWLPRRRGSHRASARVDTRPRSTSSSSRSPDTTSASVPD